MSFISTPPLAVSLLLAVLYLANLAFIAVNRQHDADDAVEVSGYEHENKLDGQHTVLLFSEDGIPDKTVHHQAPAGVIHTEHFSDATVCRDTFCRYRPVLTAFISDSGICWKLFSRPPPAC